MTAFRTCKNCVLEKAPCARRDAIKRAIAGIGITSVKVLCKDRSPRFHAGQRVSVTWPVPNCDDPEYYSATEESWPATVVSEVGSRFLIKVDDVRSDNDTPAGGYLRNASLYAKVSAQKLKPLDEPIQLVCAICGRVGLGEVGEGGCHVDAQARGWRPKGCAAFMDQEK